MTVTVFSKPSCEVENCNNVVLSKKLCSPHYSRKRNGQSLETPLGRPKKSILVRDSLGNKECATCRNWKPESDYGKNKHQLDGFSHQCRECRSVRASLVKYNMTREEFLALLDSQDNKCAICLTDDPGRNNWQIDHDHSCCAVGPSGGVTCGKCVRGILCSPCNRMLGIVKENEQTLLRAAKYLEKD